MNLDLENDFTPMEPFCYAYKNISGVILSYDLLNRMPYWNIYTNGVHQIEMRSLRGTDPEDITQEEVAKIYEKYMSQMIHLVKVRRGL